MIGIAAKHLSLFIAAALATATAVARPILVLTPHREQSPLQVLNANLADFSFPDVLLLVLINGAMQVAAFVFFRKHQALVFVAVVFAAWSAFSWWAWLSYLWSGPALPGVA